MDCVSRKINHQKCRSTVMTATNAKFTVMMITYDYWLKTKSSFDRNSTINLLPTANGKAVVAALSK